MNIQQCLQQLNRELAAVSDNAGYEAKLILSEVLDCEMNILYTYPERLLTAQQRQQIDVIQQRRSQGEPLAYILGHGHFFGLKLAVDSSTLIPRPDTEILVEQALSLALPPQARVLDLGTGTGAIALALQAAKPDWYVCAVEQQSAAVALAHYNAQQLALSLEILQSDWFSALTGRQFELIVSNPPYIQAADPHLAALQFEPLTALVADQDGLADLQHIIMQAPTYLIAGGWLWLEHGYNQADLVRALLQAAGFSQVSSVRDYGGNWRISGGQYFPV